MKSFITLPIVLLSVLAAATPIADAPTDLASREAEPAPVPAPVLLDEVEGVLLPNENHLEKRKKKKGSSNSTNSTSSATSLQFPLEAAGIAVLGAAVVLLN